MLVGVILFRSYFLQTYCCVLVQNVSGLSKGVLHRNLSNIVETVETMLMTVCDVDE
jgi:hypothetical protein